MNNKEFLENLKAVYDLLFGFAMRLTNDREDAKDLLQETTLKAFSNLKHFNPDTNFRAWISTIMRNSFITEYRKRKVKSRKANIIGDILYPSSDQYTSPAILSDLRAEEISKTVNSLGELHRTPFIMHFNGYEYLEISNYLDIPIGTVKSRLSTARHRLRSSLKEYERGGLSEVV